MKNVLWFEEFIPSELLTKSGNKIYPLNIKTSGQKMLIANTKDKHKDFYKKSYIIIPENYLGIWYKWSAGKNQNSNENTGFRYKHVVLPRNLNLDKLTLNALGLLQAEMTKHTKRASSIIFTNSDPNLVNLVMSFFKRFEIKESDWSWNITFNYKLKSIETQRLTKNRESEALDFWLKNTNIYFDKRRNKFILYSGNKNYKRLDKKTVKNGSLVICCSNIILYQLILNILDNINKLFVNESNIVYFLQGLFAGDGTLKLTSSGSIDNVSVGVIKLEEKEWLVNCLNKIGISSGFTKGDKFSVRIFNRENFLKLYKYGIFDLHNSRRNKFLNGMMKFRYDSKNPDISKGLLESQKNIKEVELNEKYFMV